MKKVAILIIGIFLSFILLSCTAADPLPEDLYTSGIFASGVDVTDDLVTSDIYPHTDNTSNIGTASLAYRNIYANSGVFADSLTVGGQLVTIGGGGGGNATAWGDITGTLSNQTDLQTALDAKSDNFSNRAILLATQESFTTALKTAYDWLVTNITVAWKAAVDTHIALVDAKGDILAATADDTLVRLAYSGVDDHVLTVDTAEATGLKWAASAGGGSTYVALAGTVTETADNLGLGDGAWGDWDLSGTLPENTVTAEIHVYKLGATDAVGVRKDGSGLNRSQDILKAQVFTVLVEVEATRIIEIMSDDVSDLDVFSLWGYWI